MDKKREVWCDYVKVLACLLVVLGHFFQSMVKSGIALDGNVFGWFNTTIYYFHVPLFFICSGYLYEQYSDVSSKSSWIENVRKKAVVLGVPYIIFSIVTWLLKTFFSGAVNTKIDGVVSVLLFQPTSPYWYLYILFFMFLITPTMKNERSMMIICVLAGLFKILSISITSVIWRVYALRGICVNEIWFVFGMLVSVVGIQRFMHRKIGALLGTCFLVLSLLAYRLNNEWLGFFLGSLACTAILMMIGGCSENRYLTRVSQYTMPIFLMHTIFAALVRVLLLRVGCDNLLIHTLLGLSVSFIGPAMAIEVLDKIGMSWIIYPRVLLKNKKGKNCD